MRRLLFALPAVLLLAIFPTSGWGDGPSQRAARFDDKAFGRLPIQFNGRVTDFDHYARNALLRLSGKETWLDAEGKSQPAVAWLLDLISGSDAFQSAPVVLVEHPPVRKLFELEASAKLRLFPIKDLIPKLEAFEERLADIRKSQTRRTDEESAMLDFADRLECLLRLMAVFRQPDFASNESMLASLQQSQELEKRPIPFVVPPKQPGGEWINLTFALILAHTEKESGIEANPAGVHYAKLIAARRDGDPAKFNQAVQELALLIKDRKLADCPLQFEAPRGWIEEGTPRLVDPYYFGDTRAFGTTVSTLHLFGGLERLMINVNFFPQGAARKEQIVNSWRLSEGRTPLPLDEIRTTPVKVAGQTGWRIDIESPDDLPVRSERMLAVGVSRGEQTWIVTCSGPKSLMTKHVDDFDQFVGSLVIASPAAAEKWLALRKPEPPANPAGTKVVLALVPDKQSVWMLQGTYFAENAPDQQIEKLRSILKSIRFRPHEKGDTPASRLPFTWTLPEGWQLDESPEGQLVVVSRDQPAFVALEILPLKADGEWSRPALIEQWRAGYRLPELSPEKINATTETLTADTRQIVLVVEDLP